VRWQLIGWLFLLSAVSYLDRVNMSIAGTSLAHDYGLSRQQLCWILSAFSAGYALCQAPGGRIADTLGPRRTLALAAVWWAVFSSLAAVVPAGSLALGLFLAIRFTLGVGEATMYPASNRVVARWIPVRERGIATGIIFTGVGIGTAVAAPLVTSVMLRYGWRASFPVCGVLGLLVGAAWYVAARDVPDQSARVSPDERALIREGVSPSVTAAPLPWRAILLNRDVALLTIAYFCFGYSAYIFFTWFFTYLSALRHLDLHATARYAMLPGLGMALGSSCGGWINDRLTRRFGPRVGRCLFASAAVTLAAVFIGLGPTIVDARLAAVILAGGAATLYLAQSSFWSASADIAGPSAGAVSGVMNMGAQIGGFITTLSTPWIGDHFGWSASFFTAAGLCLVSAVAWAAVRPDREIPSPSGIARRRAESYAAVDSASMAAIRD
jgi:ACS family glucarate transporter-like MFS transporter